ncbi:MAG: cyclic nucleotide-binding domain-containing protein [Anaerolineae bacterium]
MGGTMSEEKKIAGTLKQIPLFQNLKRSQLNNLARIMVDRSYEPGEVIIPQGREGYGFFMVISGKAEAVREESDGSLTVVNTFGPNDYFGELSLLDDGPHTASVVAVEPTTCVVLPRWSFIARLRQDADMAVEMLVEITKRFRAALDRS